MAQSNLKPQNTRTKKEQREIARMGGVASGVARRAKKTLRERLLLMGEQLITNKKGETLQREDVIALQVASKAAAGDLKAARLYAELTGQLVPQIDLKAELAAKRAPVFRGLPDPKND